MGQSNQGVQRESSKPDVVQQEPLKPDTVQQEKDLKPVTMQKYGIRWQMRKSDPTDPKKINKILVPAYINRHAKFTFEENFSQETYDVCITTDLHKTCIPFDDSTHAYDVYALMTRYSNKEIFETFY